MKTRRKKQTKRVLASALAALVAASAVPVSNSVVHAEESQDRSELKLRYTSAAPDSYAGWEKWSLPIGNSGIGAVSQVGVQTGDMPAAEKKDKKAEKAEKKDETPAVEAPKAEAAEEKKD